VAYLVAALGGALGALARWAVSLALPGTPGGLPWGTLAVNLAGCLLIGVLLAVLPARFSTFAVDVVRLGEAGAWPVAVAYVAASVLGGAACVLLGLAAARALLRPTESLLAELEAGEDQT
jgi:CrcB protein